LSARSTGSPFRTMTSGINSPRFRKNSPISTLGNC